MKPFMSVKQIRGRHNFKTTENRDFKTVGWDGWMRIQAAWGHDGIRRREIFQFKIGQQNRGR